MLRRGLVDWLCLCCTDRFVCVQYPTDLGIRALLYKGRTLGSAHTPRAHTLHPIHSSLVMFPHVHIRCPVQSWSIQIEHAQDLQTCKSSDCSYLLYQVWLPNFSDEWLKSTDSSITKFPGRKKPHTSVKFSASLYVCI